MRKVKWYPAAALVVAAVGAAADKPAAEPEATYGTPQAVFEASGRAAARKDYAALLRCASPESRDRLIGELAVAAAKCRALRLADDAKDRRLGEQFEKALARHGLSREVLGKFPAAAEPRPLAKKDGPPPPEDPKETEKAAKALSRLVKDKPAFFQEVVRLFDKMNTDGGKAERSELRDVKVTGNRARGFAVTKEGGKERREPVDFVKIRGSWYVLMNPAHVGESRAPAGGKE